MAAVVGDSSAEFMFDFGTVGQRVHAGGALKRPVVVVGHFPWYRLVAQTAGLQSFCLSQEEVEDLSRPDLWHRNQEFLNFVLSEGGSFLLATPPARARSGSWFEKELRYLASFEAKFISPRFIGS